MFLNITEDDIRADCPHSAPMTLRAFNKISPRQFNTSVSAINPFEIPRYAPSSVAQFSKSLLQQQVMPQGQMTTALELAEVESAVLAATVVDDFIDNIGFDPPTEAQEVELDIENVGAEEEKEGEVPLTRRTKPQMTESRAMGAEDTRTLQRDQDRLRERVARGAAREGAKERKPPPVGPIQPLPRPTLLRGGSVDDQYPTRGDEL